MGMKKILLKILSFSLIVAPIAYIFYLNFTNIDVTNTRILITYWKQYLLCIGIVVLGNALYFKIK